MRKLIKKCLVGSYLSYNSNGITVNGKVSDSLTKAVSTGGSSAGSSGGGGGISPSTGQAIGMVADAISSVLPNNNSEQTNSYNKALNLVSTVLGPYLWIWLLVGLGSEIGYALGDKTDQVTPEDLIADTYLGRITPGGILNIASRDKALSLYGDLDTNMALSKLGAGYGNVLNRYDQVKDKMGKVIGNSFGQLTRWNDRIGDMNTLIAGMIPIYLKVMLDELLTALMGDRWNERTMTEMNGGFGNISFGRRGLKLDKENLEMVHRITKPTIKDSIKEEEFSPEQIATFKNGGSVNVIPEGSLHARLHHMENAEGLTKKGIPVVSIAEGGELELQAEIELNEIIFRLEVTLELEKLMEDGSDNAAIEAGKLLVKEIFENTDDRTGLIKDITEGSKKEETTEDMVKQHRAFLKGGALNTKLKDLVDIAIKKNPKFVQRIGPDMKAAEFHGKKGTHLLGYAEVGSKYRVFPLILEKNGELVYYDNWEDALKEAEKIGNYIDFDTKADAELFSSMYKLSPQWKRYFDEWQVKYGSDD